MNPNITPLALPALLALGLMACATQPKPGTEATTAKTDCTHATSTAEAERCKDRSGLGPPVVDVTKPAPKPGVAGANLR